ncbi:Pvc16 family protein [Aureisphaera sp.]
MASDVISKTLQFLKAKVDTYNGNVNPIIEITNIATLNDGDEFLDSTSPITLSVVNIQEDTVARVPNVYLPNTTQSSSVEKYKNPAQNLVLSILFTAYNKEQKADKYQDGLLKLEHVIRCFQEQHVFYLDGAVEVDPSTQDHIKIILDLESLKLSELNQLWSMLGNKYMPSVLFKMRMITIQHDEEDGGSTVERLRLKLWNNNPNDIAGQLEESDEIILNNP